MFRRRHYAWVVAGATSLTLLGAAGFRSAPVVVEVAVVPARAPV